MDDFLKDNISDSDEFDFSEKPVEDFSDELASGDFSTEDFSLDDLDSLLSDDLAPEEPAPEPAPAEPAPEPAPEPEYPAPAFDYASSSFNQSPDQQAQAPQTEKKDEVLRPNRRRKKTKLQIFKESYLPLIIAATALLLILIFVIGAIGRAITRHKVAKEASIAASSSLAAQESALSEESSRLLRAAAELAKSYDFVGAVATLDSFSGDMADYPEMMSKRADYVEAQRSMTEWTDPADVLNLSFHVLIADPERAYNDSDYGWSYNENFITTTEFSRILQQLYDNGFMLVNMDDFITKTTLADGTTAYDSKSLYLPNGKKPLMITQTYVNYCLYMVDGDGDGVADKRGAGFASKLIVDDRGKIVNEMVDREGNIVTGAYDMVPILDDFIASHPDFSFGGAKATLAVTGDDGVFGYRIGDEGKRTLSEEAYTEELKGAGQIINALRSDGYKFACYTYGNMDYGDTETALIQEDLEAWAQYITPLLGETDTLVFARLSDIDEGTGAYTGDVFALLRSYGFDHFIGVSEDGNGWIHMDADYVRQGRVFVSGGQLNGNPSRFNPLFDASTILDEGRLFDE